MRRGSPLMTWPVITPTGTFPRLPFQAGNWSLSMPLATPAGFEPATCRLEGGCSIQLSYGVFRALRSSIEINTEK